MSDFRIAKTSLVSDPTPSTESYAIVGKPFSTSPLILFNGNNTAVTFSTLVAANGYLSCDTGGTGIISTAPVGKLIELEIDFNAHLVLGGGSTNTGKHNYRTQLTFNGSPISGAAVVSGSQYHEHTFFLFNTTPTSDYHKTFHWKGLFAPPSNGTIGFKVSYSNTDNTSVPQIWFQDIVFKARVVN
jgi:hypothetical protein